MFATSVRALPEAACEVAFALFPGRVDAIDQLTARMASDDLRQLADIAARQGFDAALEFAKTRCRRPRVRIRIARPASPFQL